MDNQQTQHFVDEMWDKTIVPTLVEYVRIPNKSPMFDAEWQQHGYMEDAVKLMSDWYQQHPIPGASFEVVRLEGRTPTLFIDVPGELDRTLLLYGHLDKQPEMTGWREGLGPWEPVIEGDLLYGRGAADDGYALFACVAAVLALKEQGIPHANLKIIIEASEESGSPDLPAYMDALEDRIGAPDVVICLDSGCGNYDQLWITTSLRGLAGGTLTVNVLNEGVHSGDAGGVVPSSFRIARQLLSRLEDEQTGELLLSQLHCQIPKERIEQAIHASKIMGENAFQRFPFAGNTKPQEGEVKDLILNRTWRPALEITGVDGIPDISDAGNVLRPSSALKLSVRLPPTVNADVASAALQKLFLEESPSDAQVTFVLDQTANGWNAPATEPWLDEAVNNASLAYFDLPAINMGEGGTIPFMAMLGDKYPKAQFVITGVLGPNSNAHGPNEFLHIPMGKRLTACVANIISDHFDHFA